MTSQYTKQDLQTIRFTELQDIASSLGVNLKGLSASERFTAILRAQARLLKEAQKATNTVKKPNKPAPASIKKAPVADTSPHEELLEAIGEHFAKFEKLLTKHGAHLAKIQAHLDNLDELGGEEEDDEEEEAPKAKRGAAAKPAKKASKAAADEDDEEPKAKRAAKVEWDRDDYEPNPDLPIVGGVSPPPVWNKRGRKPAGLLEWIDEYDAAVAAAGAAAGSKKGKKASKVVEEPEEEEDELATLSLKTLQKMKRKDLIATAKKINKAEGEKLIDVSEEDDDTLREEVIGYITETYSAEDAEEPEEEDEEEEEEADDEEEEEEAPPAKKAKKAAPAPAKKPSKKVVEEEDEDEEDDAVESVAKKPAWLAEGKTVEAFDPDANDGEGEWISAKVASIDEEAGEVTVHIEGDDQNEGIVGYAEVRMAKNGKKSA